MRARLLLLALAAATLVTAAAPASTTSPRILRLDGIGPLTLGMSRADAVKTGWLAGRHSGCPLGGKPYPVDYRLSGSKAPAGIAGVAEFHGGKLVGLSFTKGVRTALGVRVGQTTISRMVARYRKAGYGARAEYIDTFQGTFVTITRAGKRVLGGFGAGQTVQTLGLPGVPVCE